MCKALVGQDPLTQLTGTSRMALLKSALIYSSDITAIQSPNKPRTSSERLAQQKAMILACPTSVSTKPKRPPISSIITDLQAFQNGL